MLKRIVVGISDMKISARASEVLVTHSLGSCLGLAAWDAGARVGGLIHCLLPKATGPDVKNPNMYVNVGVPAMIRKMLSKGCTKEGLVFRAAGCARMLGIQNQFDTGSQNLAMLEALFAKNGVKLAAKDVGGSIPRTMYLCMDTGQVTITSQGKEWLL
ncbi:Chemoreceptor glutamine deamidase CheD [Fundidesulfovibrio magnetotacticus]|uniref:Probable chemoreceptor glutamine deamidase CheD n=1 Tax=Fundidesulfovibrio magnetotacticus TaxID=2730080 RepID=A0A6V8LLK4_9BACT|nr:chemotaxis protein CheD [Fundidesulfovibrio magnetotacticus]GFK93563.1 Chemoreceptor glutamine deamidase CheD [Fundidesulfovibrio magnetotacticus]